MPNAASECNSQSEAETGQWIGYGPI